MSTSALATLSLPGEALRAIRLSAQDSELVAACLKGDAAAERALYDAHVEALYRTAFRMCGGDRDVADDIIQEAFVRAFRRLDQFRGESTLRTWLTSIVVSSACRVLKRGSWLRNKSTELTEHIADGHKGSDPDLGALLDAAIAKLPAKLHVVFVMHDMEGYTHIDISTALGIPVGTSKARLHDARIKLRASLTRVYETWRL
jgi:RNA polymerase sigma-70 factor (ECF subfamily)